MKKVNISTWWMLVASKEKIGKIWEFFDFELSSHWEKIKAICEIMNIPPQENVWEHLFWIKFLKLSEGAEKLIDPINKDKKPTSIVSDTVVDKKKDWMGRGNLEKLNLKSTVNCTNTDNWLKSSNDKVIKVTEKLLLIESEELIYRKRGTKLHLEFSLFNVSIKAHWIVTKILDESEENNTRTFLIEFTYISKENVTHICETIWV